jgi:ferric-dicitrate binding protein FerR (iron transport regulator)
MKENHNIEEKWELLAKSIYDQDTQLTSEDQSSYMDEWPVDSKEKEQLLQMTKKVDLYFELKKYPSDIAWEKVQQQIHNKSKSNAYKVRRLIAQPFMRIAAALLVAALLTVAGYNLVSNWSASRQITASLAANQPVKTITLPDGTLVSLNSNTLLTYPKRFANSTREVTIEGEAFFEVTPNKEKPFIIHAGNAQIKVIGTSFNVNAYPDDKQVEVIVRTGKVQVVNKEAVSKQSDELILNPGDKGTLVYSSNALQKATNEDPNFLAWKTHDLIFRATSLGEVIRNLEKVYKVKIRLDDPHLNALLLTAHFHDYPLDFILKVIETTFQLETQKMDGQYILKAKS